MPAALPIAVRVCLSLAFGGGQLVPGFTCPTRDPLPSEGPAPRVETPAAKGKPAWIR
ncbi:hypothetical protein ABID82_004260 [Methylobacterium sp. PvP062]|jgi:hypothetical protein|uniref:Uncharacterized protein n=1 Tax=Methylobacterium radiotolerans TaxID=31998 RepID=A0ABV2NL67_9HYPH|nr:MULTISPECIES: hypothetical protein [unclassified Methylobacterium]KZC01424.1 hypothetical protein AU375_02348 [Methylobacterium radiotolerans]MBP2496022.1 hypothetical protein [Methylobacterium sp. PvP105]MBP2504107.1 hypothetical protein [Methylobacterium sp. PvP109]MCX7333103.1 hypothetical protein [Hyphomicrobiales bacterium]